MLKIIALIIAQIFLIYTIAKAESWNISEKKQRFIEQSSPVTLKKPNSFVIPVDNIEPSGGEPPKTPDKGELSDSGLPDGPRPHDGSIYILPNEPPNPPDGPRPHDGSIYILPNEPPNPPDGPNPHDGSIYILPNEPRNL